MSILTGLENWVVDDMTPKQVRHVRAVIPTEASGKVSDLYQQIRCDFQLVPPLTLFSPVPELLAAAWSIWREAQFVDGVVARPIKEAIAAAVSRTNACPYCVDAHTGMLHASSDHDVVHGILNDSHDVIPDPHMRDIVEWASATRMPGSEILRQPPFTREETPEIVGTALTYHFVNRMVSVFLTDTPMPVPAGAKGLRGMAARIFGATVGKRIAARQPVAGESLRFIPEADLPKDMKWASSSSRIASAFAGCIEIIEDEGDNALHITVQDLVRREIGKWQGESKGISRQWLEDSLTGISDQQKPAARLALLTALAPYQVDDEVINSFRKSWPGEKELLGATAWASMAAARRVSSWLVVPSDGDQKTQSSGPSDVLDINTHVPSSSVLAGNGGGL
ncbi:MAG: hypothetical protein AB2604_02865 [Candidatus Thiodiazotropha taylori]